MEATYKKSPRKHACFRGQKKFQFLRFTRKAVATVQSTKTMKKMPRTECHTLSVGKPEGWRENLAFRQGRS